MQKRPSATPYKPVELNFVHNPIVDLGIPSQEQLRSLIAGGCGVPAWVGGVWMVAVVVGARPMGQLPPWVSSRPSPPTHHCHTPRQLVPARTCGALRQKSKAAMHDASHDLERLRCAADLEARIARGEKLYVHCWGGRGRAGTVGACLLASMYG